MRQYVDVGLDYNNDDHCDVEGWFVNKNGNHKPILREYKTEKFGGPRYSELEIPTFFSVYGYYSGINVTPFHNYSLNKENSLLSSPIINDFLRRNDKSNGLVNETICALDNLIRLFTLKKKIQVYRGISLSVHHLHSLKIARMKVGEIYSDKAFMSTSYSMEHAVFYALKDNQNILLLEIELSPGIHCVPLFESKGSASYKDEFEILVQRGQKFKITNKAVTSQNGKVIVYLRMRSIR